MVTGASDETGGTSGEGATNENATGDAEKEESADDEEVASIKAERDIIQEIKQAQLERERTGNGMKLTSVFDRNVHILTLMTYFKTRNREWIKLTFWPT